MIRRISSLIHLLRWPSVLLRSVVFAGVLCVAVNGNGRVVDSSPLIPPAPQKQLLPLRPLPEMVASENRDLMHDSVPALIWAPPTRHLTWMQVTAYCPCPLCCGPSAAGITASGKPVNYHAGQFVAADPAVPFGTQLLVPGYASAPVEVIDRGSAIRGNHLDVFFPSHQQALNWGKKMLPVMVVDR